MRISVFSTVLMTVLLSSEELTQAVNLRSMAGAELTFERGESGEQDGKMLSQTGAEFLGALMGGGGGGGGSAPSGGCAQNTPAINIIDNARIMMLPGSVPGNMGGMMAQKDATEELA